MWALASVDTAHLPCVLFGTGRLTEGELGGPASTTSLMRPASALHWPELGTDNWLSWSSYTNDLLPGPHHCCHLQSLQHWGSGIHHWPSALLTPPGNNTDLRKMRQRQRSRILTTASLMATTITSAMSPDFPAEKWTKLDLCEPQSSSSSQ